MKDCLSIANIEGNISRTFESVSTRGSY